MEQEERCYVCEQGQEAKAGVCPVLPGWALKKLHLEAPSLVFSTHMLTDGLEMSCLYGEYSESKVFSPSYLTSRRSGTK